MRPALAGATEAVDWIKNRAHACGFGCPVSAMHTGVEHVRLSRRSAATRQSLGSNGAGEASLPPRRDVGLYSAFTGIIVPFAAGVFGSVTTSTPFLNVAVTLLPSTAIGSRTLRRNAP